MYISSLSLKALIAFFLISNTFVSQSYALDEDTRADGIPRGTVLTTLRDIDFPPHAIHFNFWGHHDYGQSDMSEYDHCRVTLLADTRDATYNQTRRLRAGTRLTLIDSGALHVTDRHRWITFRVNANGVYYVKCLLFNFGIERSPSIRQIRSYLATKFEITLPEPVPVGERPDPRRSRVSAPRKN